MKRRGEKNSVTGAKCLKTTPLNDYPKNVQYTFAVVQFSGTTVMQYITSRSEEQSENIFYASHANISAATRPTDPRGGQAAMEIKSRPRDTRTHTHTRVWGCVT